MERTYPSDLTDAEWKQIEPIFDRFRFDKHNPRSLLNGVFYILKTGSQWRMLPSDYPPWETAYYHFRKWRQMDLLRWIYFSGSVTGFAGPLASLLGVVPVPALR